MARHLFVTNAEYVGNYAVDITFNDSKKQRVDFEQFLAKRPHPQYDTYKNKDMFKTFYIDHGNLVWGKNWDLIFPIEQLYQGKIEL